MKNQKIKILMTAAEVAPFAKVGGLADVVGSLPPALKKIGIDVRIMMPKYGNIDEKKYRLKKKLIGVKINSEGKNVKIDIWEGKIPKSNVIVYFLAYPKYFGKKEVYSHSNDVERFLFFSQASLYSLEAIKFIPDVIHCHDYHTSAIIDLVKVTQDEKLKNIKTILTIHNLDYQGKFTKFEQLGLANLYIDSLPSLRKDAEDGDINLLVQGILGADVINTVSNTYAKEIMTTQYAPSLDNIIKLRKKDLFGILNGIDVDFFNPETDKYIYKKYSIKTIKDKNYNKIQLQKELGLPESKNIPMIGLVSRLVGQKGLDLIEDYIGNLNCQFVFLGTGAPEFENQLIELAKKFPDKVSTKILFNVGLAQKIYAGSDMFLMPSKFEPCGLGQMIAMRYGTIPIVRATGGLVDSVNSSIGFSFKKYDQISLKKTLIKALNVYHKDPKKWSLMIKKAMKEDFSWDNSAKKYLEIYQRIIN